MEEEAVEPMNRAHVLVAWSMAKARIPEDREPHGGEVATHVKGTIGSERDLDERGGAEVLKEPGHEPRISGAKRLWVWGAKRAVKLLGKAPTYKRHELNTRSSCRLTMDTERGAAGLIIHAVRRGGISPWRERSHLVESGACGVLLGMCGLEGRLVEHEGARIFVEHSEWRRRARSQEGERLDLRSLRDHIHGLEGRGEETQAREMIQVPEEGRGFTGKIREGSRTQLREPFTQRRSEPSSRRVNNHQIEWGKIVQGAEGLHGVSSMGTKTPASALGEALGLGGCAGEDLDELDGATCLGQREAESPDATEEIEHT